jgi:crotonobetainyl-CoA:carnitine CoA-transferase CaiB-like acyl-CoA transferase
LIADPHEIFTTKPLTEWAEIFAGEPDFFWSPINTLEDVMGAEQFHAAGGIVNVPDEHGGVAMVASPADFHGTPAEPRSPAPQLGQHTEEILTELGQRTNPST